MYENNGITSKTLRLKEKTFKTRFFESQRLRGKNLFTSFEHSLYKGSCLANKKTAKADTPLQFGTMKTKNGNYLSNINKSEI